MKINEQFVLQEIADEYIVVPIGGAADRLSGVIRLNETGAFLWKLLMDKDYTQEALAKELAIEYKIEFSESLHDVEAFIKTINEYGCV